MRLRCAEHWRALLHINECSPLIERNDLAVDDGFIRHRLEGFRDGWIPRGEVVIVTRAEMDFAARLEGDGAISVEFQLFCGVGRYVALRTEVQRSDPIAILQRHIM